MTDIRNNTTLTNTINVYDPEGGDDGDLRNNDVDSNVSGKPLTTNNLQTTTTHVTTTSTDLDGIRLNIDTTTLGAEAETETTTETYTTPATTTTTTATTTTPTTSTSAETTTSTTTTTTTTTTIMTCDFYHFCPLHLEKTTTEVSTSDPTTSPTSTAPSYPETTTSTTTATSSTTTGTSTIAAISETTSDYGGRDGYEDVEFTTILPPTTTTPTPTTTSSYPPKEQWRLFAELDEQRLVDTAKGNDKNSNTLHKNDHLLYAILDASWFYKYDTLDQAKNRSTAFALLYLVEYKR